MGQMARFHPDLCPAVPCKNTQILPIRQLLCLKYNQSSLTFLSFYYGVLADITPPVALAAYAAAGIAGSNPFKTGNTAFRLGIAKALVPFVFVYSPALLLVADGFTWWLFTITLLGAMLGIASLGVAFSGYLVSTLKTWERWWVALVSFLFIAPGLTTMAIGLVLMMPIAVIQYNRSRVLNN
jgi:TRAP-type uncharacterized transport system fused permease subunit